MDDITNLSAKLILLETMDENPRAQVKGCATAKAIIERLKLVHVDTSAANIYRLLMTYYRYTKKADDTMSCHTGKIDELRN